MDWVASTLRTTSEHGVSSITTADAHTSIKSLKPMSKRSIGRPKTRWEDDVLEDIKSINIGNSKKVVQSRDSWKKVVEQDRNLCRL